jgi:vitamin B12 transporter
VTHQLRLAVLSRHVLTAMLLTAVVTCLAHGQGKPSAIITGKVENESGEPLEYVNVLIVGTLDGDVTQSTGQFTFRTSHFGRQVLRASMVGMQPDTIDVMINQGDSLYVKLMLRESPVNLKEVLVTASAYSTGDEAKAMTLRSLDVITTPGAAADIFRTVQTFPGVVSIDEGSGLFVRGGDVSETTILLDQATLVHPYKYESPTGGFFGVIPPFLVAGTFFSSGGFSAKYGNALSGVLSMESLNLPPKPSCSISVGLAALSLGVNAPIIQDKLGVRFSGSQSTTALMFRVNGVRNEFTNPPNGKDANLSVVYKYSPTGQVKLFNYATQDEIGVRVDEPSFEGEYVSNETNWLHNLQWSDVAGNWLLKSSVSLNRYTVERHLGNMNLDPSDLTYKIRTDAEYGIDEKVRVSAGGEIERLENVLSGTYPKNNGVLDPSAAVYRFDERYAAERVGVYGEIEAQLMRHTVAGVGVRADHHNLAAQVVVDPRVSLRYDFTGETHARMSWGIYHQFPSPLEFNSESGSPALRAQSSQHLIVGFEHSNELAMIRLEGYYKVYSHLVLPSKAVNYVNSGRGVARGIDFFVKYGSFLQTPASGWVSYSYLHSRRLQAKDVIERYVYEEAPSPFDITHNLTIVAKGRISLVSGGITFRYATGRPTTPIVGSRFQPQGEYYLPIEGSVGSERMPDFVRLDATLSYYTTFGTANSAVFYFAVSNLLDRANPILYEYSKDYSVRRLRTTDFRKSIYFGLAVSIGSLGAGV